MAPIKFEESLKESLEKRTISPSDESWAKLSARLDASQNSNKRNAIFWWSIAATVLVLLGLTIMLFPNKEFQPNENSLVETVKSPEMDPKKVIEPKEDLKEIHEQTNQVNQESKIVSNDTKKVTNPRNTSNATVKNGVITTRNEVVAKEKSLSQPSLENTLNHKNEIINTPMSSEVVQNISVNEIVKSLSVEAETDSLLKNAQRTIIKSSEQQQSVITVDANSLLLGVEGELEESFRTKLCDTLMDGSEVVKPRVAQRNN